MSHMFQSFDMLTNFATYRVQWRNPRYLKNSFPDVCAYLDRGRLGTLFHWHWSQALLSKTAGIEIRRRGLRLDSEGRLSKLLGLAGDILHHSGRCRWGRRESIPLSIHTISIHPPICLSIYLTIYPSIYLSIHLSIYPSIYLSVYLSIYLSIHLSIYLSIHLSICLSICLSVYISDYLSVCLVIYLSICSISLSFYLSIYLSFCLSIYLLLSNYRSICFSRVALCFDMLPARYPVAGSHPSLHHRRGTRSHCNIGNAFSWNPTPERFATRLGQLQKDPSSYQRAR